MLKVRVTFTNDNEGLKELEDIKKHLKGKFTVLNESKHYLLRGSSMYANVYLDLRK